MRVRVTPDGTQEGWNLTIPPEIWEAFKKEAKYLLPEHGDKAWAAFLVNQISGLLGDKTVYVLSDIPKEVRARFDSLCEEAQLHPDSVLPILMEAAANGKGHITHFKSDQKGHFVMLINLPDQAWEAWFKIAQSAKMEPEALLGTIFEAAANQQINFTTQEVPTDAQVR